MRTVSALAVGLLLVALPAASARGVVGATVHELADAMGVPLAAPADSGLQRLEAAAGTDGGSGGPIGSAPLLPGAGDGLLDETPQLVALALGVGLVSLAGALVYGGTRYVTREDVLKNDVRGRIYGYVRERVGANLKQITDDLGLTTTNAIWHLRKLEDAGLVHSRRFNGFKVFYPAEGGVGARRMSLCITALQNGNAQEVFEFVVANPGAHQREIARALGVNHGTVRWHLKKLRVAELLTEFKRGKTSAYYTTDVGLEALRTVAGRQNVVAMSAATAVASSASPSLPPAPPASGA